MTDITLNCRKKYKIYTYTSIALNILPIVVYTIVGFIQGDVRQKITLGLTLFIAITLVTINFLFKYSIRSTIWILLLGVYAALDKITTLLIIIALCTIVDEFIISPLAKKYKEKYKINKEIDERLDGRTPGEQSNS